MSHTVTVLPPELTDIGFKAGNRKIVLLEGDTDCEIFEEWYEEHLDKLYFRPAGGYTGVESLLNTALSYSVYKRMYGIIDRDFHEDAEVAASLNNTTSHLYILTRYCIENYLLEPSALYKEAQLYHGKNVFKNILELENAILDVCKKLKTMMAVNWVLKLNALERLPDGHSILTKNEFVTMIKQKLSCDEAKALQLIDEKEKIIESALTSLEKAHQRVHGKILFHNVILLIIKIKTQPHKQYFRRSLCNRVKVISGIHSDIRKIIEERILGIQLS